MMEREKLLRYLEKRYLSKKEMLTRIPLGVQPDALWQEILSSRRAKSEVLPLYGPKGTPYWYLTTEKMVAASEKIVETLYEIDADFDPYSGPSTVSTLEEVFYTSFVEGSQISMRDALDFLSGERPPRDIEEQLIANNRAAGGFAAKYLTSGIDEPFLCELTAILTDGMDNGGGEYRVLEEVDYIPTDGDNYTFPRAQLIPDRVNDLCAYLASPAVHPLIKSAVAQGYILALRPFPEGNDRLGRILSSMILHRCGYGFLNEVSPSALIARKSYSYYEAIGNILREENGGDFTYFLEYYLELLSRGVDERAYRLRQREKQALQEESQLARTALAESIPQSGQDSDLQLPEPGPPVSVQSDLSDDDELQESFQPFDKQVDIGAVDKSACMARVKDELYRYETSDWSVIKEGAKLLLTYIKNGVEAFTFADIERDTSFSKGQITNLITHLRQKGLIESTDFIINQRKAYRFGALPALTPKDYTTEVIAMIDKLLNSMLSPNTRNLGEILRFCLPKGIITAEDYESFGGKSSLEEGLLLLEQMGFVEKIDDEDYRICRRLKDNRKDMRYSLKSILTTLYQSFGHEPFTQGMAADALGVLKSQARYLFNLFASLGILDDCGVYSTKADPRVYRLIVDPTENPEMFLIESHICDTVKVSPKPGTVDDATDAVIAQKPADSAYSEAFIEEIKSLAISTVSRRDRRLGISLLKCLQKGTLLREDYKAWGYTQTMWENDVCLGKQLGLISKEDDGIFRLNSESAPIPSKLKPSQKRAITAIFKAFGDGIFSQEMIVATLNYSPSITAASLHRLTLMKIVKQKTTGPGSQYQLLVNPKENPECFEPVA